MWLSSCLLAVLGSQGVPAMFAVAIFFELQKKNTNNASVVNVTNLVPGYFSAIGVQLSGSICMNLLCKAGSLAKFPI